MAEPPSNAGPPHLGEVDDDALRQQYAPQNREVNIDIDTSSSATGSSDNDSSLGDDAGSTDSASVTTSIRNYKYENGRRYHAYREGKYVLPNDEAEQDRLDLQHHIFQLIIGGGLYRAPIPKEGLRVLDFGTGTGIWCMDFADEHPNSFVVGTDLSPIQPEFVPPNCKFYVDDVESDWVYGPDEAFDYIHGRSMCGSISDWDALYRNCYENLNPGGWVEVQEFEAWMWQVDDPESKGIQNIVHWLTCIDEASIKIGKRFHVATEQKHKMINAGFINAHDDVYTVPIGTWPRDKRLKELGMFEREHLILCVEAYTLALFTRILGWSLEECQILIAKVKEELRNHKNHLYAYFHFTYAQKPPLPATAEG